MSQPGVRAQKKQRTWTALRRAALRLIADRGFDDVSVDEIAQAAGFSPRTFFNYFDSKEAVVFDPDPAEPAFWRAMLDARPRDESPWASLREISLEYTDRTALNLVAHKRMSEASPALASSSRSTNAGFWAMVHDWLAPRVGSSEPDTFRTQLLIATAQAVLRSTIAYWNVSDGGAVLHHLLRRGFDTVGHGLELAMPAWSITSCRACGAQELQPDVFDPLNRPGESAGSIC
jgi:AcrR family transcriptional regulator